MRSWRQAIPRVIVFAFLSLLLLAAVAYPVVKVMASEGISDLSLYQRSSELTREFATALAPGSKINNLYMIQGNKNELLPAGNAGGLLGYAEVLSDDVSIVGWLMGSWTTSSSTITYDQLMNVVDYGAQGNDMDIYRAGLNNPFFQYAGYGEVLTEMGLVSTVRDSSIDNGARFAGSLLMLLAYLLANAAPFLFRGALFILTALNPFKLFETVINGTEAADLGMLSGVAEYVGGIYSAVQDFSIGFLFPLLLILTVVGSLLFNKGSSMKRFARYAVRVFMLFAGLPLIGATYTGVVEDLNSKVSVGSEYADYLVLSSYVDFEGWVKYSRLAPPIDNEIRNPRYAKDEKRSISNREMVLDINGTRAAVPRAEELKEQYSATSDIGEIFKIGGTPKDLEESPAPPAPGIPPTTTNAESSNFSTIYSILTRHMTNAKYTSSDYNGEVSGQIQKMRSKIKSESNDESIVKMFSLSASDSRVWSAKINPFNNDPEWLKPIFWNGEDNKVESSAIGLFTPGAATNELFQFPGYPYNIYNAGDLQYDVINHGGYYSPNTPDIVSQKLQPIGPQEKGVVGGLSPIAMYNFLNTTFSDTGLTVSSPPKSASALSRDSYSAVTLAGSGVSLIMRWFENITVMSCLAMLSIMYGLAMVQLSITNIPRILSGVFGTAFGSIAFATKLMISVAVVIFQLLGIIFLYTISENIIMSMLMNFNGLVDTGGSYFGAGLTFDFIRSLLVIVITLAVTIFMIRNMKVFREMMEEVVSGAINRLMGTLDTSTGGKGLDIGQTTGGRIGGDGRLTDLARKNDADGIGGIAGLLNTAHGLESRREKLGEELGQDTGSLSDKIKARVATAGDLANAKGKDFGKAILGIDGKSHESELQAKEAGLQSLPYSSLSQDEFAEAHDGKLNNNVATNALGQKVDENGELILDENGNALDSNGRPISSMVPLGAVGAKALIGENGALLDAEGNNYMDEAGNALYQNERGQLVDAGGQLSIIDKDGVLRPLSSLPGQNGKPLSAAKEAKRLEGMRFNADQFADMKAEQGITHYGFNRSGKLVGGDGKALKVRGASGLSPASIDDKGFVTDRNGNRVTASNIVGKIDSRGFEEVHDASSGQTYLKHRGDAAIRPLSSPDKVPVNQTLTSLAAQSNRANDTAQRASAHVSELKENGASPYVVMQAQRFADKANLTAKQAQTTFNQAMEKSVTSASDIASTQPVTSEQITSATRYMQDEQNQLREASSKLVQLRDAGAPREEMVRQQRRIDEQRQRVQNAISNTDDMKTAHQAGRSYNEVKNARVRVEKAERSFANAQSVYAQAVEAGEPKPQLAKLQQRVNKSSQVLSDMQRNMNLVSQPPSGTPIQIDQASAALGQAQVQYKQSKQRVESLMSQNAPAQDVEQAKRVQQKAKGKYAEAYAHKQNVISPAGWNTATTSPKVMDVPKISQANGFASLTSAGITTYEQYSAEIGKQSGSLTQNQARLKQAKERLSVLRKSNRPPLHIEAAESEVKGLKQNIQIQTAKVESLKGNAHGLLKTGQFQPVIASRPIRKHGSVIINNLVNMAHTQSMYDKLAYQDKAGVITRSGREQLKSLDSHLKYMRRNLVGSGIKENALQDHASITNSAKQMQQSWISFINGKSDENIEQ